jgi:hypothetical protein
VPAECGQSFCQPTSLALTFGCLNLLPYIQGIKILEKRFMRHHVPVLLAAIANHAVELFYTLSDMIEQSRDSTSCLACKTFMLRYKPTC